MDNEQIGYRKEDDFTDDDQKGKKKLNKYDSYNEYDNNNDEDIDNPLLRNNFEEFMNDEMSEPDIMYWCKDNESATQLLRKCIKWMNDKNYETMKGYLKLKEEEEKDNLLGQNQINKPGFVKSFYLVK